VILVAAFLCPSPPAEEEATAEGSSAGFAGLPKHPSELEFRDLEFEIQKPDRLELKNGIRLFLMEDDELPLASVRVLIRTGSIYEPADKIGLAELTGRVMRTGGTKDLSGDEIDEELEFLAASVETSIGREMGTASIDCLSKDLDRCLEILAGILRQPVFPMEKLELERARVEERIRRRNDDPQSVASREIALAVYGRESPWARIPSIATVDSVTREDLVDFHKRYFHPNNIMVGVAGDFDRAHLLQKLEEVFGDWPVQEVDFPEVPPVDQDIERRVVYVPKDINQANIRIGHFGYNRLDPDRFAIEVMNFIYGTGSFTSRLMAEIRSDMGLAYAVWGYVGRGTDIGLYQAGAETRTESALRTVEEMLRITREMRKNPVTREERDRAVDSMTNRFVFLYDSPSKIVNQYMDLEYYGYPEDFLDTYLENLRAVTTGDVEAAARKYLHPDRAIVLLVGKREDLGGDLEQFGPVEVHELTEE
jgi:predicted Zn-dependent peptidase